MLALALVLQVGCAGSSYPYLKMAVLSAPNRGAEQVPATALTVRLVQRGELELVPGDDPQADVLLVDQGRPLLQGGDRQAIVDTCLQSARGIVVVGGVPSWWPSFEQNECSPLLVAHSDAGGAALVVVDPAHPVTLGLGGFWSPPIETPPLPTPSIAMAWACQQNGTRTVVISLGTEPAVRPDEQFISLVHRALRWVGGRLDGQHNTLSRAELRAGLELLFNGHDLTGWDATVDAWQVRNGMIEGQGPAMLASNASFTTGELRFAFRPIQGKASLVVTDGHAGDGKTALTLPLNPCPLGPPAPSDARFRPNAWNILRLRLTPTQVEIRLNGAEPVTRPLPTSLHHLPRQLRFDLAHGARLRLRDVLLRASNKGSKRSSPR